jgi:hypothetical protein
VRRKQTRAFDSRGSTTLSQPYFATRGRLTKRNIKHAKAGVVYASSYCLAYLLPRHRTRRYGWLAPRRSKAFLFRIYVGCKQWHGSAEEVGMRHRACALELRVDQSTILIYGIGDGSPAADLLTGPESGSIGPAISFSEIRTDKRRCDRTKSRSEMAGHWPFTDQSRPAKLRAKERQEKLDCSRLLVHHISR